MHARAASLARAFDELRLPRLQTASRRTGGGPGPRYPRFFAASLWPGSNVVYRVHAASRNRRRLARNRIPDGSRLAVVV